VGAVAAASGPPLGALIIQSAGWRWAFLVNPPIALVTWLAGRRILHETRDETSRLPDAVGVILLTLSMGLLALGIVQGNDWGWSDPRIVASLLGAALFFAPALVRSARHPAPVLPLELFRVRSFSVANAGAVLFSAAFAAMLLAGVLFLNGVWHYSILRTGLAVTPGPIMAAICAPIAGRLADRFGHRVVLVPGALLFSAGMALLRLRIGLHPAYLTEWLPSALLTGCGVGLTLPTLGSAAAASLPSARFGAGSAVTSTARQFGFVLGVSVLVAVLGTPAPGQILAAFQHGWDFIASAAATSGVLCLALGMTVQRSVAAADTAAA
jgi:MFS family permease